MFSLKIKTDNAAFRDFSPVVNGRANEVARILRRIANEVEAGDNRGRAMDINGNTVGFWKLV
jgi:hypothetical protein